MCDIRLVPITECYQSAIEDYLASFDDKRPKVTYHEDRIPGLDHLEEYECISEWLEFTKTMAGKISWYLSIRLNDGKMIGSAVLRHDLIYDDDDYAFCSHIGYSIRPDERKKGYGGLQLALMLKEARKIGLEKVRIVCLDSNICSNEIIRANRGVYIDSITGEESGLLINRYDVDTV